MSFPAAIASSCLPPVHILGCGSIGLLFASSMRIACPSYPVIMLLRPRHQEHLRSYANLNDNKKVELTTTTHHHLSDQRRRELLSSAPPVYNNRRDEQRLHYCPPRYIRAAVKKAHHTGQQIYVVDIPAQIIRLGVAQRSVQNLILTTKAVDAVDAVDSVRHSLHEDANIIVMTNGALAVKEQLVSSGIVGNRRLVLASTTHGAHRDDHEHTHFLSFDPNMTMNNNHLYKVVHAGLGRTFIESFASNDKADVDNISTHLTNLWNESGLRAECLSPLESHALQWKKLAANCVINPLTALRRCKNGELTNGRRHGVSDEYNKKKDQDSIMYDLIREVSEVAIAESLSVFTGKSQRMFLQSCLCYEELVRFVERVISDTSLNTSSMLQDVMAKRHPTEIQYFNGYVARIGNERHGMNMKANFYICDKVETLTSNF